MTEEGESGRSMEPGDSNDVTVGSGTQATVDDTRGTLVLWMRTWSVRVGLHVEDLHGHVLAIGQCVGGGVADALAADC